LITFKKLAEDDLERVLEWRTSEYVTAFMYTDIEKDLDNQRKWFKSISNDDTNYYWVIYSNDTPIGLISLNNIDRRNRKATFGYYIGDLNYSIIAGRIHPYLYNYVFSELGLNKLYAEVMDGNESMMKMHHYYGFTHTATFKEHVFKHGQFIDVEYFELLASTWHEKCQKFHRYTAQFPL